MSLNVVSNYAASVAHRYLSKADASASTSLAKLSAGTRVLGAKDDAASLAIGSRLNVEVQSQRQAKVNAGQAASLLQIADGAMAKVNDILVRLKTLAVQAGSGQLSSTERGMLDTEYQALLAEVDRIATDTEFNGVSLVNGATTTDTLLNSQSNTLNVLQAADGFASIEFGNGVGDAAVRFAYDAATNVMTAKNLTTGESQGIDIGSAAIGLNATQSVNFNQIGVVVELNAAFDKTVDIAPLNTFTPLGGGAGVIDAQTIEIASVDAGAIAGLQSVGGSWITIANNTASSSTLIFAGFQGTVDLTSTGTKSVAMSDGTGNFTLTFSLTSVFSDSGTSSRMTVNEELGAFGFGDAATSNQTDFSFKLGTGTTAGVDDVTISISAISTAALGLNGTDVRTEGNADTASVAISSAIDTLNTARAGVGAAQNRLEFAADNLATTIENTEAARSSLLDLDVAAEMSAFTAKQVLVQSGVAMLAQANQIPQNLMRLFQ